MSSRAVKRRQTRPASSDSKLATKTPVRPWIPIAASSLLSMLPLCIYWNQFRQLFFFHDDFSLLYDLSRSTFLQWVFQPFAGESIFPLFKLLWFGAIWVFGGSYMALLILEWITHFGICAALGWLLIRLRFNPVAAALAVVTFGLPSTNIETLGWSMQWCSQLDMLFFLLAWHALLTILERPASFGWRAWYVTVIVASALCSSRGIVTGIVLGLYIVLTGEGRRRMGLCAASIIPTVLLVLATWLVVPPFRESHLGHFTYSVTYLALNPIYALALWTPPHVSPMLFWGTIKVAVIGWAIYRASPAVRPFLYALVAFDLATAAALGYARTWTGLSTTFSSRYQYIPLLVFAPMLAVVVSDWRWEWKLVISILWMWVLVRQWPGTMEHWASWRGTRLRNALAHNRPYQTFDPSRLTTAAARRLIEQYQLH